MKLWHKKQGPVDRALAEINRQIAELQRQTLRESAMAAPASSPPPAPATVRTFIETMLAPPSRVTAATYRTQREIPDCEGGLLASLEPTELPFARPHQPDLFTHAARPKPPATAADDKLARLLAVGTLRPPKPVLKHVARENRRRFLMWMGLALLTVWLLYSVVR